MKTLRLTLKKQWFDMTKSGVKTEDYRELNYYWFVRLVIDYKSTFAQYMGYYPAEIKEIYGKQELDKAIVDMYNHNNSHYRFKKCKTNTMTLGYPKKGDKERTLKLEHKGIEIRTGNPEWGAESNKIYFVIKHGKTINTDLQEAIKKAKPNMDKIKDVDKHLDEIRNSGIKQI